MRRTASIRFAAFALTLALPLEFVVAQQVPGTPTDTSFMSPIAPAHKTSHRLKRAKRLVKQGTSLKPEERQSQVSLKGGRLAIEANTAPLAQILEKLGAFGSMTVEGTEPVDPVFGTYGPGTPREVLTELLTGSGYNFILIGVSADGLPRRLILNGRASKSTAPTSSGATEVAVGQATSRRRTSAEPGDAQSLGSAQAPAAEGAADEASSGPGSGTPLGPGAIEHVPPNEQTDTQDSGTRVQQNLQRLQQMQAAQAQPGSTPQH